MFDIILGYLLIGAGLASLLFMWLNTSAFVEYMNLFNLDQFLFVSEYNEATVDDPLMTYTAFLQYRYPNFWARLLNCPKCLIYWLALFIHAPVLVMLPLGAFLTFLCFIPSILITTYSGLCLYFMLCRLMKYNE